MNVASLVRCNQQRGKTKRGDGLVISARSWPVERCFAYDRRSTRRAWAAGQGGGRAKCKQRRSGEREKEKKKSIIEPSIWRASARKNRICPTLASMSSMGFFTLLTGRLTNSLPACCGTRARMIKPGSPAMQMAQRGKRNEWAESLCEENGSVEGRAPESRQGIQATDLV